VLSELGEVDGGVTLVPESSPEPLPFSISESTFSIYGDKLDKFYSVESTVSLTEVLFKVYKLVLKD
jgi:hypothetical protein